MSSSADLTVTLDEQLQGAYAHGVGEGLEQVGLDVRQGAVEAVGAQRHGVSGRGWY